MGKRRKLLSATAGEKVFDVFVYATLGLCASFSGSSR